MTRDLLTERWNPSQVDESGATFWHNDKNELHREGDQPAVIFSDGGMHWCKNGKFYRGGNKPAIVYPDGRMGWYKNGKQHRDNKPAVILPGGMRQWFKDGERYYPSNKKQTA